MDKMTFENWLNLMTDTTDAVMSPLGTSIWLDGLFQLQQLKSATFFKQAAEMTSEESKSIALLTDALKNQISQKNFSVIAHACLMSNSPYYKYINAATRGGQIDYKFTSAETGDFKPWENASTMGTSFYTNVDGTYRIPFYTYNHENSHIVLFRKYYANLPITDTELSELLILIEWFCISVDLILAFDLKRTNQNSCFTDLCRVPALKSDENVFNEFCNDLSSLNRFASLFRQAF